MAGITVEENVSSSLPLSLGTEHSHSEVLQWDQSIRGTLFLISPRALKTFGPALTNGHWAAR